MNITARDSEGGLSTLVPTTSDVDQLIVLDDEGDEIFRGTPEECECYMNAHGLRPHCNCEVIDPYAAQMGDHIISLGWESF